MLNEQNIEVRKSSISGSGIFAKRRFEPGEIVLKWKTDKRVTRSRIEDVAPEDKHYLLDYDSEYLFIVQPPERYINHSCDANTRMGEYCDIAVRVIENGEEITSDYQDSPYVRFKCLCGAKNCRGEIG